MQKLNERRLERQEMKKLIAACVEMTTKEVERAEASHKATISGELIDFYESQTKHPSLELQRLRMVASKKRVLDKCLSKIFPKRIQ